ncbi:MAG: hypothetical protein MJZ93_01230 [Paludibacteraceae bacterium]|nr:hypothetical protein [Paludibacteraceae bacterium]
MLNYHIQELPDLQQDSEDIVFPKLDSYSQFDNKKMIRRIAMEAGVKEGVVMATLIALPHALKNILLEGHTCKIDGLGTFSLSLAFEPKTNEDGTNESNHRKVMINRLNLKVDSAFLSELREEAQFDWKDSRIVAVSSSKGQLEEHLRLAIKWFDTHPTLTLQEYAKLIGISRSAASRELKRITGNPDSGISTQGQGNRKVWVSVSKNALHI